MILLFHVLCLFSFPPPGAMSVCAHISHLRQLDSPRPGTLSVPNIDPPSLSLFCVFCGSALNEGLCPISDLPVDPLICSWYLDSVDLIPYSSFTHPSSLPPHRSSYRWIIHWHWLIPHANHCLLMSGTISSVYPL